MCLPHKPVSRQKNAQLSSKPKLHKSFIYWYVHVKQYKKPIKYVYLS